jgi:hypothetical protein
MSRPVFAVIHPSRKPWLQSLVFVIQAIGLRAVYLGKRWTHLRDHTVKLDTIKYFYVISFEDIILL